MTRKASASGMIGPGLTRRGFLAAASAAAFGVTQLAGCGDDATAPTTEQPDTSASDTEEGTATTSEGDATTSAAGTKTLIVYFSRADENYADGGTEWLEVGHTKVMADYIREALGADEYEIVPVESYPEGYDDCCDVAKEEQRDDARPAIANELPDVADYDNVFVGAPIWWGDEPMIVRTFLDAVDLSDKFVVPFTTHGGSGLGSFPSSLASRVPSAIMLDGLAVAGTAVDGAQEDVTSWALGLELA